MRTIAVIQAIVIVALSGLAAYEREESASYRAAVATGFDALRACAAKVEEKEATIAGLERVVVLRGMQADRCKMVIDKLTRGLGLPREEE